MADAAKGGGGLSRLVLWFVIAALMATVWYLASERNERHFRVAPDNGQLVIERGRFFPIGTTAAGAKIYAPVPLPAGEKAPGELEFDDQNSADRYLFSLFGDWAKSAAKKGDTHAAAGYVDRAAQLPGLTGAQVAELMAMKADLAWDDAATEVQQAATLVETAIQNLQGVASGKGPHAWEAQQEVDRLRALAQALHAGPAKPGSTPGAPAIPAPPPGAAPSQPQGAAPAQPQGAAPAQPQSSPPARQAPATPAAPSAK